MEHPGNIDQRTVKERRKPTETISGSLQVVRGRYEGQRTRTDWRVGADSDMIKVTFGGKPS
jgi:hypothetical protein